MNQPTLRVLLVKGDPDTALQAALQRLSCAVSAVRETPHGETILAALNVSDAELVSWLLADRDEVPPYRPGSLLFYSYSDCSDIGEA